MKNIDQIHKIDLHMHSNMSDGTETPEEIFEKIKDFGIDLFSVTDHDAIQDASVIKAFRKENAPFFITGGEFSCKDPLGKYHILGYGYDPSAPAINTLVKNGHISRIERMYQRLDKLKDEFNITFSDEDIFKLFSNKNPGKPHLALLMLKYGYVRSKDQAFRDILNNIKVPGSHYLPEEAITAILESGGIPVLGHPSLGSGDEIVVGKDMENRLERLMEMGLRGVEAYYSGFTPEMQQEILNLAAANDLYVTAGSDYHGKNKTVILGDNHLNDVSEAPSGLFRFLEDVRLR